MYALHIALSYIDKSSLTSIFGNIFAEYEINKYRDICICIDISNCVSFKNSRLKLADCFLRKYSTAKLIHIIIHIIFNISVNFVVQILLIREQPHHQLILLFPVSSTASTSTAL